MVTRGKALRDSSRTFRITYSSQERVAGMFVLLAVLALLALLLGSEKAQEFFGQHVVLYGVARSAQGVGPGTVVRISGLQVGSVSSVEISETNEVIIAMRIFALYRDRLRQDSTAQMTGSSLLATSATIDISPGSPASPALEDGAEIRIEEALSVNELMASLRPISDQLTKAVGQASAVLAAIEPAQVSQAVAGVAEAATELRAVTQHLRSGEGTLGMLLYDGEFWQATRETVSLLNSVLSATRLTLTEVRARVAELEPLIASANTTTATVEDVTVGLPALVAEVELAVKQINLTLAVLNTELQQFPDLVFRLRLTLEEANRTLEGMQRVWPLSSAMARGSEQTLIEAQPLTE